MANVARVMQSERTANSRPHASNGRPHASNGRPHASNGRPHASRSDEESSTGSHRWVVNSPKSNRLTPSDASLERANTRSRPILDSASQPALPCCSGAYVTYTGEPVRVPLTSFPEYPSPARASSALARSMSPGPRAFERVAEGRVASDADAHAARSSRNSRARAGEGPRVHENAKVTGGFRPQPITRAQDEA
jgi:hypothetical protein